MNNFDAQTRTNTREAAGLVCVPFRPYHYVTQLIGTGTVTSGGPGFNNTDSTGSGRQIAILVPPGVNHGAQLVWRFWGRALGIRMLMPNENSQFDVEIDGVVYGPFDSWCRSLDEWGSEPNQDGWGQVIVANDLDDCEHVAKLKLYADVVGSVSNRIDVMGYLAQERAGYQRPLPAGQSYYGTLTGSAVSIPHGNTANYAERVERIHYSNTSGADVTVSIWHSTTEYRFIVPANSKVTWEHGAGMDGNFMHSASTGAVVNFVVIGGAA